MKNSKVQVDDHEVRVISIYATRWRHRPQADGGQPHLSLGRLEEFYGLFRDQLPQVISRQQHPAEVLTFTPASSIMPEAATADPSVPAEVDVKFSRAESWLFVLPSDQVVAVLDFDFATDPLDIDPVPTITVLERCAYAQLLVDGLDLEPILPIWRGKQMLRRSMRISCCPLSGTRSFSPLTLRAARCRMMRKRSRELFTGWILQPPRI